jgi:hypothetical protein
MMSLAVAAAALPEPEDGVDGIGNVSGKGLMPNQLSAKGVRAIACAAPFDGCSIKYEGEASAGLGAIAWVNVPVVGPRWHFMVWKDQDGDNLFSAGDYFGIANNGESVSLIADVGSIRMRRATPDDL